MNKIRFLPPNDIIFQGLFLLSFLINVFYTLYFVKLSKYEQGHEKSNEMCSTRDSSFSSLHHDEQYQTFRNYDVWEKQLAQGKSIENPQRMAQIFMKGAVEHSLRGGEGEVGWLWLLAAFDCDSSNKEIVYNIIENYRRLHPAFQSLAASTLASSSLPSLDKSDLMSTEEILQWNIENKLETIHVLPMVLDSDILAFSSMIKILQFDVNDRNIQMLHKNVEKTFVPLYLNSWREIDASSSWTDLNHHMFKKQMQELENNSSFMNSLCDIEGFDDLVISFRSAALDYFQSHGFSHDMAAIKANQPLVPWVSVHRHDSTHQPHAHVSESLVGVYYVSVPSHAGVLQLFDPRGKNQFYNMDDVHAPGMPPFHRVIEIVPRPGRLVLIPGWLLHKVLEGDVTSDGYRISIALNLKGEWQETSSLHYRHQPSRVPAWFTEPGKD